MAGQYRSVLDVRGVKAVLDAVQTVWDSYEATANRQMQSTRVPMDILIQRMITPIASGAAFSRHPVTGADETVVEAVAGTSEDLLQYGQTPRRWIARDEEFSSDWDLLPTPVLQEIVQTTRDISDQLHYPADVEWAYDGKRVWWLQTRPITALRGLTIYSNRISKEYLPGLVKPLVWSVNIPMINGAWVDIFSRIVGTLSLDPATLAKQFYFRAYFNMSGMGELLERLGLPVDTLEQSLGLVPSSQAPFGFRPKMLRYGLRFLRFLSSLVVFHRRLDRWEGAARRTLADAGVKLGQARDLRSRLAWMDDFLPIMRSFAQHRILSLLLHLTLGMLGRSAVRGLGVEDVGQLEVPDPQLEVLDPVQGLRALRQALQLLPKKLRQRMESLPAEEFLGLEGAEVVQAELSRFMGRFGHLSQSGNDFSAKPWRENPEGVLKLAAATADVAIDAKETRLAHRPRLLSTWSRRVTRRRIDRERVGAVFSEGVGLLRIWALAIGVELVECGLASEAEDIFFLTLDELRGFAAADLDRETLADNICQRRDAYMAAEDIELPSMILGEQPPAGRSRRVGTDTLFGIATSRGEYQGRVCVLRSIDEADRFQDGEVLVVPFSDVAWSPLFARAGAVVAESGGVLSHSSIIAREIGIPAVASVEGACALLEGCVVCVNGLEGSVRILGRITDAGRTEDAGAPPSTL